MNTNADFENIEIPDFIPVMIIPSSSPLVSVELTKISSLIILLSRQVYLMETKTRTTYLISMKMIKRQPNRSEWIR